MDYMSLSQCVVMPQINMKVKTCAGFDPMTCWARWWCITLPTEPSDGPFAPYCFLFLSFLPSFASPIILYLVSYRQKKKSPRSHSETPSLCSILLHLFWTINNRGGNNTSPLPGHWCPTQPKSPFITSRKHKWSVSRFYWCLLLQTRTKPDSTQETARSLNQYECKTTQRGWILKQRLYILLYYIFAVYKMQKTRIIL